MQVQPEPIAEPPAAAQAPVIPRPETQRNTAEPLIRRPVEPRPERRSELRPARAAANQASLADLVKTRPESLQPRITEVETVAPKVAGGRWAEFHDSRRLEPGRGGRTRLEPMPPPPRALLAADREPEHRSSFLTIAVPGIAAILAVGALLLWSGSLRERVLRQDAEMTALQEQNRKLADTLAQMNVDQKVVGTVNPGSAPANALAQATNPPLEPTQPQTPAAAGNDDAEAANGNGGAPAPAPNTAAPAPKQAAPSAGKREGVSVPPPMQSSAQRKGSHPPVDTGYHPEIVPPYPTIPQAQNTARETSSSPAPAQQTYRAPSPVSGSPKPAVSSATPARATQPSAASQSALSGTNPAPSYGIGSSPAYSPTGNGVYASALAQNIEAVEGLQRQSPVPLREFHGREGVSTKVTPGLFVSLRSLDQAHGTYALVVNGSSGSYQLRGYVNGPLGFVDNATHRGYQLVILRIAGQEAYGYVRPVQ
jgi:hypothetical protein